MFRALSSWGKIVGEARSDSGINLSFSTGFLVCVFGLVYKSGGSPAIFTKFLHVFFHDIFTFFISVGCGFILIINNLYKYINNLSYLITY